MKLVKHEVSDWTVGELRKALADFPDDMPVRVAPLEEPGGDLEAPLQVVTGTEIRPFAERWGRGPAQWERRRRNTSRSNATTRPGSTPPSALG